MSEPKNIRILRAAEKLFAEKGFDGASIRDISAEAGANVSMISYYFGSKENLMKAIIRDRIEGTIETLSQIAKDETTTPVEKIETFVKRFIVSKLQHPEFTRIMMTEQVLKRNEEFAALTAELRTSLATHLQGLLNLATRKGAVRKKVDVVLLISTLNGTVNSLMNSRDFYKYYHRISGKKAETFDADYDGLVLDHAQTLVKFFLLDEK